MPRTAIVCCLAALCAAVAAARAETAPPAALGECAALADDALRLACYDRLAGRAESAAPPVPAGRTVEAALPPPQPAGGGMQPAARPSFLSKYWELDAADKRGAFQFAGYRPNFLLPLHTTSRINTSPASPTRAATRLGDYKKAEVKLQLSLRTKLIEQFILPGADLWFGYTQQSLWQLYSPGESAPFRSTDYEPELMYVLPVQEGLRALPGGWQWRYAMLGFAHQSNGQSEPLSRSWNRLYLGAGIERDDVSLVLRLAKRLPEDDEDDDNPDLTDFRGRGDVMLHWTPGRATASLTWRTTLRRFDRGGLQLDYTYPVDPASTRALRWYVQLFSGYGETLLDYNFRQTSLGLGLTLFEF